MKWTLCERGYVIRNGLKQEAVRMSYANNDSALFVSIRCGNVYMTVLEATGEDIKDFNLISALHNEEENHENGKE